MTQRLRLPSLINFTMVAWKALSKEFGRCTERAYFPHLDAYLILFDKGKAAPLPDERYSLVWTSRLPLKMSADHLIVEQQSERHSLRLKFFNACNNIDMEESDALNKYTHEDPQRQSEYDWESAFLKAWDRPLRLGQARRLVQKIAADYEMDPPTVSYKPRRANEEGDVISEYDEGKIYLCELTEHAVLHEMAHMLVEKYATFGEAICANHGPIFTWKAIELFHRYGTVPIDYLVATARDSHLLGDGAYTKAEGPHSIARFIK